MSDQSSVISEQSSFEACAAGLSQCALIRARLEEATGEWVGTLELHQLSGSLAVHSRIADLRAAGLAIENRVETVRGRKHSFYRLVEEGKPQMDTDGRR